eukprot:gene4164-5928_t
MVKGKVLRIFDTKAVFENQENGNCLLVSQVKESGTRFYEKYHRNQLPDLGNTSQVIPYEHIFGFYDLLSGSYVALVVESESFVSIGVAVNSSNGGYNVRKAKKVIIIPLFRNGRLLSDNKQVDEDNYLLLLHKSFSEHTFFFSIYNDITLTQQKQAKVQLNNAKSGFNNSTDSLHTLADPRFFWNRDVIMDLIVHDCDEWIVVFMSAFIEIHMDMTLEESRFSLLFISRRSRHRQGCRFTKRGLDENGYAANFVETEQILFFSDGKITSYTQIRGSIPLKWSSPVHMRYDPAVYIDENRSLSADLAEKHVTDIIQNYSDNSNNCNVVFINLVDNKKDQGKLGVAFKDVIDNIRSRVSPILLTYVWFDFHKETKQKGKWNNLSKLVTQVDELFRSQKFFCKLSNGQVVQWQSGVIRTNCMDNLDRTNVVQSLFARRSLMLQVNKGAALDAPGASVLDTKYSNFEKTFKSVWANNADAMSLGYAGTGALKVDFTKTGKRTYKGMFNDGVNSCMRYYINNFTDGIKQDSIDLLLGNYRPDPLAPSPFGQRNAQESLSSNITKAFVLMIIIFSALLLLLPPVLPLTSQQQTTSADSMQLLAAENNLKHLKTHMLVSLLVTIVIILYMIYKIVKVGSKLGEKMVTYPELCPEPLPAGRT